MATPAERGLRIPAESAPHDRCLMAWPTMRRVDFWRGHLGAARDCYAIVARAINEVEPVLMIADIGEGLAAEQWMRGEVEVIELPIDDSWIRDSGPVFVLDEVGGRAAVDFGFNGWGDRHGPWHRDAAVGEALCAHLGIERIEAPFVLEGSAFAVDGAGTLVAIESNVLDRARNPGLTRPEVEANLRDHLGVERIIWLAGGLRHDVYGDVGNVLSFIEPGRVLLQSTADERDPDRELANENARILADHGIESVLIDVLPHDDVFDEDHRIPYVNIYRANGAVFVPLMGAAADRTTLAQIEEAHPGLAVVGVPGRVLAYGGGGIRCITAPVPSASGAPGI